MFKVSEVTSEAPALFSTDLQKKVYEMFSESEIPFQRVDTDETITMDDCVLIDQKLDMKMVKTLFVCNRQQTECYIFVTCGDKPFRSKEFSHALGISRVSFAPVELMRVMLHTEIGAATALSALVDTECKVKIVIDNDVLAEEYYGCSDGTTTSYLKLRTSDVVERILPAAGHKPLIITV